MISERRRVWRRRRRWARIPGVPLGPDTIDTLQPLGDPPGEPVVGHVPGSNVESIVVDQSVEMIR